MTFTNVTDTQTDRQTTCDCNTALCTKVHRAVKIQNPNEITPEGPHWVDAVTVWA